VAHRTNQEWLDLIDQLERLANDPEETVVRRHKAEGILNDILRPGGMTPVAVLAMRANVRRKDGEDRVITDLEYEYGGDIV
jgi:hypothetical protein